MKSREHHRLKVAKKINLDEVFEVDGNYFYVCKKEIEFYHPTAIKAKATHYYLKVFARKNQIDLARSLVK